jgi:release factor glutamine methyltransferase
MVQEQITVGEAIFEAAERLAVAGIDSPRSDAIALLIFATCLRREDFIREPERQLGSREAIIFEKSIQLRCQRRPVAYITGERWFYGRPFKINRAVLIPRPETEMLVEFAIEKCSALERPITIADIGTGSGCIAVSVASEIPHANVFAVDISSQALLIAKKNVAKHELTGRITLFNGDLLTPLAGRSFDLILSNPPYIPRVDLENLMPEVVQFEPDLALSAGAGDDGMEFHRRLIDQSRTYLVDGGWLAMEVGIGQAESVCLHAEESGYKSVYVRHDMGGIGRVVGAQWMT